MNIPWRQELFGSIDKAAVNTYAVCGDNTRLNIPNKRREDDMVACVRATHAAGFKDVVPHFSCKNNQKGMLDRLRRLCREVNVVLVVSGCGKIGKMDTVGVLQALSSLHRDTVEGAQLHCAYNPYEPDTAREHVRCEEKLRTGLCKG